MWQVFLTDFNGISIIPDQAWSEENDFQLYTDASGGLGFRGFFQGKWFQGKWPDDVQRNSSIAWKEFFPIVVEVGLWGDLLKGKRIVLRSDNQSVVAILNQKTSKCPAIIKLVRFFVLHCLKCNLSFYAKHICGKII